MRKSSIMYEGGISMRKFTVLTIFAVLIGGLLGLPAVDVRADGTETLGLPSISIAPGSAILTAGTGLVTQPGTISIDVPLGAGVRQVLLYWEGQMSTDVPGDDTIVVNGTEVTGTRIGGQAFFFSGAFSSSFRADITSLGLISPGPNMLTVDGLDFTEVANGAGVLVIIDDGLTNAEIALRDGLDLAFFDFPDPRQNTIPQTFTFPSVDTDREATLNMFFSSVAGEVSTGGDLRPTTIEIRVDGVVVQVLTNVLASLDGEEWDTVTTTVTIPAGASMVTVQAFSTPSFDPLGASLTWIAAGLSVPIPPPPIGDQGCTPGYWKNHTEAWDPTGFLTSQTVGSVFSEAAAFPSIASETLLDALEFKGGPGAQGAARILLRAAVASLLNAAHPDVSFTHSVSAIINDVDDALASGERSTMLALASQLDADNNLGCPLN